MSRFAALLLFALASGPVVAADATGEVAVRVDIVEDVIRIDAELTIPASTREVWDVLTDFEHVPRFISNVAASKVLARNGNVVRVAQTGKAGFGPFSFEFKSTREVTLTPFEKLESRMIEGNMKRFRSTTELEAVGNATRLSHHSESVPESLLLLNLGRSVIESETREHYREILREVLRRKAGGK
jgi:ribosome-associated toxin RatA of RatAB toxin-antitoxin module